MNRENKTWPYYLFGGRMRSSTAGLMVAFVLLFWVYEANQPEPAPPQEQQTQVVPPGFVPDPNYTWVPRTSVRRTPKVPTETTTPTTTTTTTAPTTTTTSPTSPTSPTGPTPTTPLPPGAPAPPPTSTTPAPPGPLPTTTPPPR